MSISLIKQEFNDLIINFEDEPEIVVSKPTAWSFKGLLFDRVVNPNTEAPFPALVKQLALFAGAAGSSMILPVPSNIAMADVASISEKNMLRVVTTYFDTLSKNRIEAGLKPGIIKYSHQIKYAFLATTILGGFLADQLTEENHQIGPSFLGIAITDLQRELRLFLVNKVKNEKGKKVKLGRSFSLKMFLLSGIATGVITGASKGMTPILLNGLIGAAGVVVKCTKEIEKASALNLVALLAMGAVTSLGIDVGLFALQNDRFSIMDNDFKPYCVGLLIYVVLTKIKNSLLKWQIGMDDDDEEDAPVKTVQTDDSEKIIDPAMWKQVMVTLLIMGISFKLMLHYAKPSKSASKSLKVAKIGSIGPLITNAVASTGARMSVNIIKQISQADIVVIAIAMALLGLQVGVEPFKDSLSTTQTTALTLLGVCSTNLIAKKVKFWQLSRPFFVGVLNTTD